MIIYYVLIDSFFKEFSNKNSLDYLIMLPKIVFGFIVSNIIDKTKNFDIWRNSNNIIIRFKQKN